MAMLLFSNAATALTLPERATLLSTLPPYGQGLVCSPADLRRVSDACAALERAAPDGQPGFPRDLMLVDGRWRLRFTSTDPLGLLESVPDGMLGSAPPLPGPLQSLIDGSPLKPISVEQRIDVMGRRVINCVELAPWPSGPIGDALAAAPGPLGDTLGALRQATVVLELDHSFSVPGDGSAGRRQAAASSTINLSLETVRRTLDSAGDGLPSLIPRDSTYSLPQLLQPSGSFETTFADESLRICRGGWPSNEIRVFERVPEAGAVAAADAKGSAEELSFEEELWCEDMNDFVPSD